MPMLLPLLVEVWKTNKRDIIIEKLYVFRLLYSLELNLKIEASFDKINLMMRRKKRRPCRRGAASQNEECRAVPRTPCVCPYPPLLRRTDPVKAGPPPTGGGPVHFSLDGGWAAEYAPTGANAGQRCHFRGRCFSACFTFGGGSDDSRSFWRIAGPSASIRPHIFNSRRRVLID